MLVEIRDAVATQLEVAKYIGNLFVTFLTKVVGKAIGLVGKGILQGLEDQVQSKLLGSFNENNSMDPYSINFLKPI